MAALAQTKRAMMGPLFIGIASLIWATDAVFRYPLTKTLDPTFIVFVEHVLGVVMLLPWILKNYRQQLTTLSIQQWLSAAFCGVGGSALASVILSASFLYINPSVAVLLQKLQPVLVVIIAYLVLQERPSRKFYICGIIAILAGIVLSFPDLNFSFLSKGMDLHSRGIEYALLAALIWSVSTVSGKVLLNKTPPVLAIFLRFVFGLIALSILLALAKDPIHWETLQSSSSLLSLIYLSLVPGVFAMGIYYVGMSKTQASVTSFIELIYPIGGVLLNTLFLHTPLDQVQAIAGAILLAAVTLISL